MIKHELMKVSDLQAFQVRELRQNAIDKLNERIKERGYNQAKSLTIVKNNDGYWVADGNHRLKVLQDNNIEYVPCVIYEGEGDIYNLAVQANVDEDTYAPMDLFDDLECYSKMINECYSKSDICKHLNWDKNKPTIFTKILDSVSVNVLESMKKYQTGRTEKNSVNTEFTMTWINDSGIFNICNEYQERLFKSYIDDKFNWNKSKVQSESSKYKQWQEFICYAENKLLNADDLPIIIKLIENNTFKTIDQLQDKINSLNKKASNKLICGDSIQELEKLDDCSIDVVITDPPYGIEYESNHSKYNEYVTKTGILNDGLDEATKLLNSVCEVLSRKTKQDAHLYICTGWKYSNEFKTIIEKYFSVKNCIIWDKGNASMGDLEGAWGNAYEMIFFATKGNKKLNTRKHDVINVSRVPTVKAIHPTQKPEGLIKVLLEVSAQPADTICDPFMGSGSTIKAIKEYGDLNYIGIELDKERFEKAKAYIGGDL